MSSLLTRSWNFVRRHHRKIVVLGVVVGSAALLKRYVDSKLSEWAAKDRAECLERLKREQHFNSTRKTCRSTAASLMYSIKDRIRVMCDCEALTTIIKSRPPDRLEIWEKLKRLSFARLIVQVHEAALLVTLVNVQLNIVGGYMFVDAMSADSNQPPRLPRIIQNQYLLAVQKFCDDSLEKHCSFVQEAVDQVIGKVSLKEKLTIARVHELLMRADNYLEAFTVALYSFTGLHTRAVELLKAARISVKSTTGDDDHVLARILDETMDVVESDDYKKVLGIAVEMGFSIVADALFEYFAASVPSDTSDTDSVESFANSNGISLPLAKIIPMLTDLSERLLNGFDLTEHLVSTLFASEAQRTISANIYESFSQLGNLDGDGPWKK